MNGKLWVWAIVVWVVIAVLAFSKYVSETPGRTALAVLLSVGLVIVLMATRWLYPRLRRR